MAPAATMSAPVKHNIERYVPLATILSTVVAAVAAAFAFMQAKAASDDLAEVSRTRELDWSPALNILAIRSTAESSAPLGVFLQNVGKGPAKINAVCQSRPFSDLRPIEGLRMSGSTLRRGDILKDDETIPLIEFRPIAEEGWTEQQLRSVHMALRTLEEQGSAITVCYESMYRGCFVAKRGPDTGQGWRQERADDCSDPCCSGK
jgi:hypothetical protein